jgi:hypothetical protein
MLSRRNTVHRIFSGPEFNAVENQTVRQHRQSVKEWGLSLTLPVYKNIQLFVAGK